MIFPNFFVRNPKIALCVIRIIGIILFSKLFKKDSGPASAMLCLSGECHYPLWRYKPQSEFLGNLFDVNRLRRDSLRSGFRFVPDWHVRVGLAV